MSRFATILLLAFLCVTSLISLSTQQNVKLSLFVMSKCPDVRDYYNRLFTSLMNSPVASIVDLHVDFIATKDESSKYGFKSMHGDTEVQGDLIEACLQAMTVGNQTAFYKTLACVTDYYRAIPQYFDTCVPQFFGGAISMRDVETCAYGPKGKELMTESITRTQLLNVRNSPTLYIEDEKVCEWNGASCPYTKLEQYERAICQKKQGEKPSYCSRFD